MNKTMLLFLVLSLSSCAHMQYEVLYSADSAGTHKCDPVVMQKNFIDMSFAAPSKDEKLDWTKHEEMTGYSECAHLKREADVVIVECKKPALYRQISSRKPAQCHKFLSDQKVQITR